MGSSISSAGFSIEDVLKVIINLNFNKTHGHDKIGIRMLKICGFFISRPLEIIYNYYLEKGKFSLQWKKAYAVTVHRKIINCR